MFFINIGVLGLIRAQSEILVSLISSLHIKATFWAHKRYITNFLKFDYILNFLKTNLSVGVLILQVSFINCIWIRALLQRITQINFSNHHLVLVENSDDVTGNWKLIPIKCHPWIFTFQIYVSPTITLNERYIEDSQTKIHPNTPYRQCWGRFVLSNTISPVNFRNGHYCWREIDLLKEEKVDINPNAELPNVIITIIVNHYVSRHLVDYKSSCNIIYSKILAKLGLGLL